MVVVAIIIVIRTIATPPNSDELPPAKGNHATTTVLSAPGAINSVPGGSQLSKFAKAMNEANLTAAHALTKGGSTLTVSQLDAIVFPYATAVKVYAYQLHFVVWPTTAQADVQNEYSQLSSFLTFLETIGTVNPNNLTVWVSQLRSAASTTQLADNNLRHAVGLGPSYTFP